MKYKLMPYVYAQAKGVPSGDCRWYVPCWWSSLTIPVPGWWRMSICSAPEILVAPLLETGDSRTVYLPRGKWIDYQSGKVYEGGYQTIKVGEIPAVILVRDGSLIPHVPLAQRTDQIQWDKVEMKAYKVDAKTCTGLLYKPGDNQLQTIIK